MMRKRNHLAVIKAFEETIVTIWEHYSNLETYILDKNKTNRIKRDRLMAHISEQTFVSLAVAFEEFITEIFIALIAKDNTNFSKYINKLEKDQSPYLDGYLQIVLPKNLTLDQTARLVTPDNDNIKFGDSKALIKKANNWLVNTYNNKFKALSEDDKRLIDAFKKIRNYLAHRSPKSRSGMVHALARIETGSPLCKNIGLGSRAALQFKDPGTYLKAKHENFRRVEIY